jgi:hypothetical protein
MNQDIDGAADPRRLAPAGSNQPGTGTGAEEAPPTSGTAETDPAGEAQGGAGMLAENAPIGFTADVGGEPRSTDDAEEVRRLTPAASEHGPVTDGERAQRQETEGDEGV